MKESIAQSFIVNLIFFFFGVLVILFFGSLNYTKAFKAKNRIITTIEQYGGYPDPDETATINPSYPTYQKGAKEIESGLLKSGYQTTGDNTDTMEKCNNYKKRQFGDSDDVAKLVYPTSNPSSRSFDYCIIRINNNNGLGEYYQVVTFMQIEIPIFGEFLKFPVKGETKVLYDNIG